MKYIYYAPDFIHPDGTKGKVGCTKHLKERLRSQGITNYKVLETHTDSKIASKRENELQVEYNCVEKFVKVPYTHSETLWKHSPVSKKGYKKKKEWIAKSVATRKKNGSYVTTDETKKKISKALTDIKRPYNWNNVAGTGNVNSKFTEDDVRYIRMVAYKQTSHRDIPPKGKYSFGELSKKYNCHKKAISGIYNRTSYKDIT